ncbi:MogA/MoaB family molybdenum cofactor biosynthesis protein [Arthrobacter cryoconiti]|uniref:Molybdenum cofactor biosynthesis protein B n=1 Tax=Arthrobacter cryoconiti TaxID=748907 RepID=A0ABV8R5B1_9MICC|nr:MogA/MoaB family molybdenum cofactor biosynthesis protein [Arthrobacter cryoconiti]MCC9067227.1 MogA/MoaB family molybdenum cofactor biosynthesis protein [Arthrobacter cryoconiti]
MNDSNSEVSPGAAGVLIASTRAAAGVYEDKTGPVIVDWLRERGFDVAEPVVVADGPAVGQALRALLVNQPSVVLTSGGTGLSPTDQTPEMTLPLLEREVPGIMEAIRAAGLSKTPMAALSRGHAGLAGDTLIVNLPGSPKGVMDGLAVLEPIIKHICEQVRGGHGH